MSEYHVSVLLQNVLDYLSVKPGGRYIDATLGGAGHTKAIIEKGGIVLGIDQDEDAIEYVENQLKMENAKCKIGEQLTIVRGNFALIGDIAREHGFDQVDGILFDLGISSHHVDTPERGFSFMKDAPLDMRMDQSTQVTAADLVNGLTERELTELFTKYGEEPFAKRIAKAIVERRKEEQIMRTVELGQLIARVVRVKSKVHPATKVFQALRIAVNDELHILESAFEQAIQLLKPGGRLLVISFHSLEDRIVKQTFSKFEKNRLGTLVVKKPLIPSEKEQTENNRSRSAKLRVFEKI
jgi:16S rRNA (cytosine1402-N4)-methyltransferase